MVYLPDETELTNNSQDYIEFHNSENTNITLDTSNNNLVVKQGDQIIVLNRVQWQSIVTGVCGEYMLKREISSVKQ
jgi:hypothetical protein